MFNFGSFIDDASKSPSISPDKRELYSPDKEAIPILNPGSKRPPGISLQTSDDELSAAAASREVEKKQVRKPPAMAPLNIDEDSQEEEDHDLDGQKSPELIIPKQSRAPR